MSELFKYKLLSFVRYLGDALFYPFFALYLKETGKTPTEIGFILSITPILSIIVNPIYANLFKKAKNVKTVLGIITLIEALIIVLIGFSSNFYLVTTLTILLAISGSAHYGLMDSLINLFANQNKVNYSGIRMYGSIAYIIGTTLGGYLIKFINYQFCFIAGAVLFVVSAICYLMMKPLTEESSSKVDTKNISYFSLFRNKEFLIFFILYFLLMGTMFGTDAFYSVYLESLGITSSQYGMVYSYFVLFEVATIIIVGKWFNKVKKEYLLLISCLCLSIRTFVNYSSLPVLVIVSSSMFRGIGYGILLYVSFPLVIKMVGEKASTFAIMGMSLFQAILVGTIDNLGGKIIDNYSFKLFYFIALIASLMIVIYGVCFCIYNKVQSSKIIEEKN